YSNGVIRQALKARGIQAVIPQKSDEIASRKRKGSNGGRPRASMPAPIGAAMSSNATSVLPSSGARSPPATTNWPSPTAPPPSYAPSSPGYANKRQALDPTHSPNVRPLRKQRSVHRLPSTHEKRPVNTLILSCSTYCAFDSSRLGPRL